MRRQAYGFIEPCVKYVQEHGQLCELFDGDAPHKSGGAVASASSRSPRSCAATSRTSSTSRRSRGRRTVPPRRSPSSNRRSRPGERGRAAGHRAARRAARITCATRPHRAATNGPPSTTSPAASPTAPCWSSGQRRSVGAQAGAGQAARRGRLVQRPRARARRGAGPALAGRARAARHDHAAGLRGPNRITCWRCRPCPQPHENWKTMLLAGRVEPDHVEQFATSARHDPPRGVPSGAAELRRIFDDRSFFESLRVEPYYALHRDAGPRGGAVLRSPDRRHRAAAGSRSCTATTARRTSSSTTAGWCCSTTR